MIAPHSPFAPQCETIAVCLDDSPAHPVSATAAPPPAPAAFAMTPLERRASASLATIFGLRMLGLFLVLPVFALEARQYPGGDDPARIGLAMGIYGLTQGLLQIPFGLASDRWGRKPVIQLGLIVFALGSLWAALAPDLDHLILGRALQGAGAVSAAVTALLADLTRDEVRTKAMALVGSSIGLMFALSLVLSPLLAQWVGLAGLFALTTVLTLGGMVVVHSVVPNAEPSPQSPVSEGLKRVLTHLGLLRLYFGVFVLHAVQLAMWVSIPAFLVRAGLAQDHHWQVYLPAVLLSFVFMGVFLFPLERRGRLRLAFIVAIALIALVQILLLWLASGDPSLTTLSVLLFVFFCGFNVLEACQPSLASRLAPASARGAAMGVYNTLQSLGFFVGGWVGGLLVRGYGTQGLFVSCASAMLLWLLVASGMSAPGRHDPPPKAP